MKLSTRLILGSLIFMFIGAIATGCSQVVPAQVFTIDDPADELSSMLSIIKNQGFDTSDYTIFNDRILVEGDIAFDMEILRKQISTSANPIIDLGVSETSRQYTHVYTISPQRAMQPIRVYCFDYDFYFGAYPFYRVRADWSAAVDRAINVWNSTGVVQFIRVYDTNCDIALAGVNAGATFISQSTFPSSGSDQPGNAIYINYYSDNLYLNDSQKENTMVHEIGHALGLRHMNINENDRLYIPGTPTSDASSVMITDCYKSWTGFSTGDFQAIMYLFANNTPYIILYDQANYTGKRCLVRGTNHSIWFDGFNDMASSVRVFNGAVVSLYVDVEYKGGNLFTYSDIPNLSTYGYNKKISSVWFY